MHLMFSIMKPNVIPDLPTAPLYVTPLPVKAAKLADVLSLSEFLSPSTCALLETIPAIRGEGERDVDDD